MSTVQRIFHLIDILGVDQKDFAAGIGVTDKIVSKWKTGALQSYMKYLRQIVEFFGVSPDYLLEQGVFSNWDEIVEYPHAVLRGICDQLPVGFTDPLVDKNQTLEAWLDKRLCYEITGDVELELIRWFYRYIESVKIIGADSLPSNFSKAKAAVVFKTSEYKMLARKKKKNMLTSGNDNWLPYHPTGTVPILGRIPAGTPLTTVEEIEGYEAVTISDPENCYYLRVEGDSMIGAGIQSGDLVLIRQQQCADPGQIVACKVNGDEATLKRFRKQGETVLLMPENPNYEPIVVPAKDFETGYAQIFGVAIEVKRKL